MTWQARSDNGVENLSGSLSGSDDFIVFLRFNSADSLDGFVNAKTSPVNLDPRDDFSAFVRWSFGDSQNQSGNGLNYRLYDSFITSDAITDDELSDIYDYWGEQFSLDFT